MPKPNASFDEQAAKSELRELVRKTIEEATIEMYLAGVSAGTVSNLNGKAFKSVDEWRCRPLTREYPYVYIGGIYLKRS